MKNLYLLKTNKLSRLHSYTSNCDRSLGISREYLQWRDARHIYITSSSDVKLGDWVLDDDDYTTLYKVDNEIFIMLDEAKKIILTTDQDLIDDGVQAIDDEFLEWFVDNPSCNEVYIGKVEYGTSKGVPKYWLGEYKIIIPKRESYSDIKHNDTLTKMLSDYDKLNQETFNSKRGLAEVQLKDPNTCEHFKEVGYLKDICDCYTLLPKIKELSFETYDKEKSEAISYYAQKLVREIQNFITSEKKYTDQDMIEFAKFSNRKEDKSKKDLLEIWNKKFKNK